MKDRNMGKLEKIRRFAAKILVGGEVVDEIDDALAIRNLVDVHDAYRRSKEAEKMRDHAEKLKEKALLYVMRSLDRYAERRNLPLISRDNDYKVGFY